MNAVEVDGLTVRAGGRDLVHGVSLRVEAGTWCTVIGPNGAGKTTLVEAVAGLRRVNAGSICLEGRPIAGMKERARARVVSLVPQHPEVPAGMSVREYVALGRTAHHGLLRAASARDWSLVDDVLRRLSLDEFAERDVITLSGGERQRMVLGRALAQTAPVMVLDEPITGLDMRHQIELLELLKKEVAEGGLSVLATCTTSRWPASSPTGSSCSIEVGSSSRAGRATSSAAPSSEPRTRWRCASSRSTAPMSSCRPARAARSRAALLLGRAMSHLVDSGKALRGSRAPHARIVATVGPASEDDDVIEALVAAGVDVFRLSFAHGDIPSNLARLRKLRTLAPDLAIMVDIPGPKIRAGSFGATPVELNIGHELDLVEGFGQSSTADRIVVEQERTSCRCFASATPSTSVTAASRST